MQLVGQPDNAYLQLLDFAVINQNLNGTNIIKNIREDSVK